MTLAQKRFFTAVPLGIIAGLVCVTLVSQNMPEIWAWDNMLLWTLFSDRVLIGLVVFLAGTFTSHPILGFKLHSWLRGAAMGALVSLPIAFGALVDPSTLPAEITATFVFWATVGSGAIYGLIIDLIATKIGGEGKALLG
jgi:hypothetical protein